MFRVVILSCFLLLASACAGSPRLAMAPSIELASENELPLPDAVNSGGAYVYTLGSLDKVTVEVDGMPDSLREVVVDGQGMVSYPLAGSVFAGGLTTIELARALEIGMRENFVRNPRVSVNVLEPVSQVLTVEGEVERPGLYPVYREMTLSQAVAMAGGETDYARRSVVLVFRKSGGQDYVGAYDLNGIRYGNYADPQLYPEDRVAVGESKALRLLQTIQPYVSLVTTPLIVWLRR